MSSPVAPIVERSRDRLSVADLLILVACCAVGFWSAMRVESAESVHPISGELRPFRTDNAFILALAIGSVIGVVAFELRDLATGRATRLTLGRTLGLYPLWVAFSIGCGQFLLGGLLEWLLLPLGLLVLVFGLIHLGVGSIAIALLVFGTFSPELFRDAEIRTWRDVLGLLACVLSAVAIFLAAISIEL